LPTRPPAVALLIHARDGPHGGLSRRAAFFSFESWTLIGLLELSQKIVSGGGNGVRAEAGLFNRRCKKEPNKRY
jgi:hypothetical protein